MKLYSAKEGEISNPTKKQLNRVGLSDREKKAFSHKSTPRSKALKGVPKEWAKSKWFPKLSDHEKQSYMNDSKAYGNK
jgi:hypothetical protein